MNIQEIRQKYPQYNSISDEELAERLYQKHYADSEYSREQVFERLGVAPAQTGQPVQQDNRGMSLQHRFVNKFVEPAITMGTSMAAEPVAGLMGAAQIRAGRGAEVGANTVEATREAMTYMPRSQEGQQSLQSVAGMLAPVADAIGAVEQRLGDAGYNLAGPVGGMLGEILPTATMELLGLGALKKGKNIAKTVENAVPDRQAQNLLDAGNRFDVPILTTDVKPPKTFFGRWSQSISEKLGPLGSGTSRSSQQKAREAAVLGFAEQFDIDIDSPFSDQIVKSLNRQAAKDLELAGAVRNRAVTSLDNFGPLPMERTRAEIARQIAKQEQLGAKANTTLINNLKDDLAAIDGGDFTHIKNIRTEVISDLKAINRGEDTRAAASVQAVKSAMDKDMMAFARQHDRTAAADWVRSNRAFAEAYGRQKNTELKRILNLGDATPEKVIPLLRGGKPSELNRLYKSLTPQGRVAAQKAIIQDALKDAKFFEVDANPNPNTFATALNKPNRQQAIRVFFQGEDKAAIDGLSRLLQATRRAQDGSQVLKTGEQNLLMILGPLMGFGAATSPGVVIPAVTAGSIIAKVYESTKFRNLLLRLSNTQSGSTAETRLLELAAAFVVPELLAAKTEQEEKDKLAQLQ